MTTIHAVSATKRDLFDIHHISGYDLIPNEGIEHLVLLCTENVIISNTKFTVIQKLTMSTWHEHAPLKAYNKN